MNLALFPIQGDSASPACRNAQVTALGRAVQENIGEVKHVRVGEAEDGGVVPVGRS